MGRLIGGDPSLLRRINSAVVLHALRAAERATLTEVTRVTGLSRPTVEGVVEDLIGAGLVVEEAADVTVVRRQGRPARRFRFRAEAGYLLGLDIGAHRVSAVVADLDGRVLGAQDRGVAESASAEERLERARTVVAELLRRAGVPRSALRAVGVGTPGIVETDGTVRLCAALPEWTGLRLGERLSRSFKCPVLVENDANAAAVAEHWKGAAVDSDDVVLVLAGLSPGAGSLIGGRLHRGYGGAAGEIGALHLLGREVTPETLLSTTDVPLPPLDHQAAIEVFTRAGDGDPGACAAVDRFFRRLVHDVAALALALDPELVVIGGATAGLADLLGPLRNELARYCLRPPRVTLSSLGEAAVAMGALRLALDHVDQQLFAVEGTVTGRQGLGW
ncbi:ROK family transcriptional regulator [Streptomyces acidiscabies]|uniref:ROK family transcriptional regulator n=2 Tax=Streptomyces TaxID=1883 RepID=A0AAP6EIP9_9ACTN|nr:ROK family transcriptional regulator [Streptomyces acidiscabies]MBP5941051.1 ROK family transcriptional regulator [Streptomyces sp. LBUM 1476]MBZ3912367.1 ROK family transcriptional regulator [Streptomyces acidiscabies]MDX2964143.1 ROK family transcriptional regulator [Streptomyces acidiscabies]MDX3021672.1 ROK family transcriptional regulator [Streptomyces acidiscabies]MDX3793939.1 ROK family transcriptional regulator [Streptomyces acidiscabies]